MPRSAPSRASLEAEVAALREQVENLKAADAHHVAAIRFFDAMERVNRIITRADRMDALLSDVLEEMLGLLRCDRAWLLFPCDPTAPSWCVPMERTRPEWAGAMAMGVDVPMDATAAGALSLALETDGPVVFDHASGRAPPGDSAEAFSVRAQLILAVHPKLGPPWLLGIHHCGQAHAYTHEEVITFAGIGRRVGDALGTHLALRDLQASVHRYRTLVDEAPEAIVVLEEDGRIVDANSRAAELFGIDGGALTGASLAGFMVTPEGGPHPLRMGMARALAGDVVQFECGCRGAGERTRICDVRLVPLPAETRPRVRASLLDITERVELQRQLVHLQRMEAIGEIAGGVAHDFNNLLTVINCYADLLATGPSDPKRTAEFGERITRSAAEAARLTRQLLAFSRRSHLEPSVVDLNDVVAGVALVLARSVGDHVAFAIDLHERRVPAWIDRPQLEQVIVNLVNNARDAMPRGGHIHVTTGTRTIEVANAHDLPPGTYGALSVADDGVGMDEATLVRLFEPFFTTKPRGQGTGLGLSTAYGVIRQSGGAIAVESAPGRGTTFTVLLPLTGGAGQVAQRERVARVSPARRGTEAVLVVEDRESLAEATCQVLGEAGYRVVVARTAADALAHEATGAPIDLLFTDLQLPDLDGAGLAEALLARRPGLRVLYTSGYSAAAMALLAGRARPGEFLQKPYRVEALLARVQTLLDAPGREAGTVSPSP